MIRTQPTTQFAVILLSFFLADTGSAQPVDQQGKLIDVFQVDQAPVLDGRLDDDAWAFGTVIDDLH
jgi:hypothetical protein